MNEARERALQELVDAQFASRLFAKDDSLWGVAAQLEAAIRLNWVDASLHAAGVIAEAETLRNRLAAQGIDRFVLAGMGGSSLGPDMLARNAGVNLEILDSTHPDAVLAAVSHLGRTAVIASSKSGTTVETRSHLALFEAEFLKHDIDPCERVIIITDPGSELERYGRKAGYTVILADPNVGGRFSVFTAFGLVPPVLAGAQLAGVVASASAALPDLSQDALTNPALMLAAACVAENTNRTERNGLWMRKDEPYPGLADWVEQLVAESTGKVGQGILPVVSLGNRTHAENRRERLPDQELGASLVTWMVATTAMGFLLGVNPFDQPDVERAKQAARAILGGAAQPEPEPDQSYTPISLEALSLESLLQDIRPELSPAGFVSICLFAPNTHTEEDGVLQSLLQDTLTQPVTIGWGPRFLHSTGQLHKGGPRDGVYVQVVAPSQQDVAIPAQSFTFDELLRAQADGDARVLTETGQRVFRLEASLSDVVAALST